MWPGFNNLVPRVFLNDNRGRKESPGNEVAGLIPRLGDIGGYSAPKGLSPRIPIFLSPQNPIFYLICINSLIRAPED